MNFIKKRLNGLAALITAAAVALTSLPMTAAAEGSSEPITVNVTVEEGKKASEYNFSDALYYYTDLKEYVLTKDTSIESIASATGLLKDFYEVAEWKLWGSSQKSGFDQNKEYYTVLDCDDDDKTTLVVSSSEGQELLTKSKAQEAKTIAKDKNTAVYENGYMPLIELKVKPTTYNIKVYENKYSTAGKTPVFEFDTDIEGKYFPTVELADGDYLPKLPLCYTSASDTEYESRSYRNGKYSSMTSGEIFWDFLSEMSELEKSNVNEFDFAKLNVYLYKPTITYNATELDYKIFSDGKITAEENEYISEHSTAGDMWKISNGNGTTYSYSYIKGDELAQKIWDLIENSNNYDTSLTPVDSIYIAKGIGDNLNIIGSEINGPNGKYLSGINGNIIKYEFGTTPISIEKAACSISLITPHKTPTEWTIYGVDFNGEDAYMATKTKKNGKLESAEDFTFDDSALYTPIVLINKVEDKKYEIPCDEVQGGKLVYTVSDHSAFPVKDGVDYWIFSYDGSFYNVNDSETLWSEIKNIINKGMAYDSSLAKLIPKNAWTDALLNIDSSGKIITAPAGEWVVPKYIFNGIKGIDGWVFIKFSDGITWGITPSTIDLNGMPESGVDLSVVFSDNSDDLSTVVKNVKNTQYKTEISFKHTGDFGFVARLQIDLSEQMKNAPQGEYYANFYEIINDNEMDLKYSEKLDSSNIASYDLCRANKLALIVCHDKLDGSVIRDAEINITAPANGGDAAEAPTVTGGAVIEKFEWSPEPVNGKFAADTAYTLSVYLKAAANTTLSKNLTATVNGSEAKVTAGENENVIVTYTFAKTAADDVSAPVISPNGGSFTGSQAVTITCATDGAAVYYTTDGTAPTAASTKYTGTFTITESTTVKAIAVKNSVSSAVVSATFTKRSSGGGSYGGGSTVNEPVKPTINGKSASWADIAAQLAMLANGSEITIDLNGNYNVPVEVIKIIADKDIKATFVVDSRRNWYLDGAEIETPAAADMTVLQITSLDSSSLRGTAGVKFHINGTNNPTALTVSFQKSDAGKFANLYRKDGKKLVFVGVAKVDANGAAKVSASDKGDYVLMLCEYSDLPGDMDNDGALTATDASAALKYTVELIEDGNVLAADIDGDGFITARDAAIILKRIVGLE